MFRIRYYDQVIHPDHFKGWLGFWVRLVNAIRWKLEVLVQRMVMRYLVSEGGLPQGRRVDMRRMFALDVAAEKLERDRTSPRIAQVEPPPRPAPAPRAARYQAGTQQSALETAHAIENEQPVRPRRLDNMIASYGAPGREKNYGYGRRYMADPEGDFEPLEDV